MSAFEEMADAIRSESAYMLKSRAECESPDSLSSPGANLLRDARDQIVIVVRDNRERLTRDDDFSAEIGEIATEAPNVYTARLWAEFVDLGGYSEDLSEGFEEFPADMTSVATTALAKILTRLMQDIVGDLQEALNEDLSAEED